MIAKNRTMRTIEKLRKEYSSLEKWYYHLTLDSLGDRNLLNDKSQCINAMNIVAIAQNLYDVKVVQFDWMRNHGHFIVYADGQRCLLFFDYSKDRLNARLIKDGYPPLPDSWFMNLRKLNSFRDLVNASTYSGRNSYDARGDILPSGYLWSSNYLLFSDISELLEYRTIASIGPAQVRRLLGSRVNLPPDYKVCKLGYVLPESYLMKTPDGRMTKVRSLYKDSKDYTYKMFRDYNTYRKTAADAGELWTPTGGDIDALIDSLLNYGYGVSGIDGLKMDDRYDIAVKLSSRYGLSPEIIASKLNISSSTVARMIYSSTKNNR